MGDSAKFSVTVIDKPQAPEGPLQSSIEGNMVTLLWKKIKDDGGAALEHYQLEKIDNEKSSWCACGHTLDNTYSLACLPPSPTSSGSPPSIGWETPSPWSARTS